MLRKITILLVALLVSFIVYVASQSSEIMSKASIKINSNEQEVYLHIDNHLKWEEWSPWVALDESAEKFFGGPLQGVGSYYKWKGNDDIGEGISTIVDNKKNEYVKFRLDYVKPAKSTVMSEFEITKLSPVQVRVDWVIYGKKNFTAKLLNLFVNCEEITEKQMEKGLIKLKAVLEMER